MATLAPAFSSNRMVREYVDRVYAPAVAALDERQANDGRLSRDLRAWEKDIRAHWSHIHFGAIEVRAEGAERLYAVEIYLGDLGADGVGVELYADAVGEHEAVRLPMQREAPLTGVANAYLFTARIAASRPASDFTPRVVPRRDGARVPQELRAIAWLR